MKLNSKPTVAADPTVIMARQVLYRFASLTLADPLAGAWDRLDTLRNDSPLVEAAALIREVAKISPSELGLGERPTAELDPRPVLDQLPGSRHAHNAEYEKTFGLLVSSICPPYETEYIGSKFEFQRSNGLSDINGFYHAFGLAIADKHPERADHIVLELEFMAHLLELDRRAANDAGELRKNHLQVCRDAQSRFLKEHLAWWVPAFAKLLALESRSGFFAAAGVFLAALIPVERAVLKVDRQSRPLSASRPELPETCEGCQLAT